MTSKVSSSEKHKNYQKSGEPHDERETTEITKIRQERGNITADSTYVKKLTWGHKKRVCP